MRFSTVLSAAVILVAPAWAYDGCQAEFAPRPEICSKFAFQDERSQRVCVVPGEQSLFYDMNGMPDPGDLDPKLVEMATLVTNVFESGNPSSAFASCRDIGDRRGYTCGYVGFTTGTNDAEKIVRLYSERKPENALTPFMDQLHALSQVDFCQTDARASTAGLETFCDAWKQEACNDPNFNAVQRDWSYETYMRPSARFAAAAGVTSPLGMLIFYDTVIQHGYQYTEPGFNIVRLLQLAGVRDDQESEQAYLTRFLSTRRELQCCYPDAVWPLSAIRSADLQFLVDQFETYKDLNAPLPLRFFGKTVSTGMLDLTRDLQNC